MTKFLRNYMKFTFDEIKSLLGTSERNLSELQLIFSIKCPILSAKDIFSIVQITFENYWSDADSVVNEITWTNSMYAGKTMLEIQEMNIDPKANLHSTYILRNLFKIIRDTDIWDEQVKSKTMMKLADKERRRILAQLKKNYRNLTLQDEFEVICEFIELIEKKS